MDLVDGDGLSAVWSPGDPAAAGLGWRRYRRRRGGGGRGSTCQAKGSAFSGSGFAVRVEQVELVDGAGCRRGMNISHTPACWRSRIGWRRPSQLLKSPTTETRVALGAQTAKRTPAMPSMTIGCAPRHRPISWCVPSRSRCRSRSPSSSGRSCRGPRFPRWCRPSRSAGDRAGRDTPANSPAGCVSDSGTAVSPSMRRDGAAPGRKHAQDTAVFRLVRAEQGEGVAMAASTSAVMAAGSGVVQPCDVSFSVTRMASSSRPRSGMPIQPGRLAAS
jgi:hypothetical protein